MIVFQIALAYHRHLNLAQTPEYGEWCQNRFERQASEMGRWLGVRAGDRGGDQV
jgi:hypothetical protein